MKIELSGYLDTRTANFIEVRGHPSTGSKYNIAVLKQRGKGRSDLLNEDSNHVI